MKYRGRGASFRESAQERELAHFLIAGTVFGGTIAALLLVASVLVGCEASPVSVQP